MTIERMTANDSEAIAALERLCFSVPWSIQSLREETENPRARFFVAKEKDSVIGYAGAWRVLDEYEFANVAVDPAARGRGVANALLQAIFCAAEREGVARFSLEVRTSNAAAIALYEKNGFRRVGVRPKYYTDGENALIMIKENDRLR